MVKKGEEKESERLHYSLIYPRKEILLFMRRKKKEEEREEEEGNIFYIFLRKKRRRRRREEEKRLALVYSRRYRVRTIIVASQTRFLKTFVSVFAFD